MPHTLISKTKNGLDVYVDLESSHAATHIKQHPEILDYLKEILPAYRLTEQVVRFETDLGRVVGKMDLVETKEGDEIFYAKRPNREKYTRFVKNKTAEPTNFVTVEIRKTSDAACEIFTAFIGRLTPSFPFGKTDPNQENKRFWNTHALVAENSEYLPETVTNECPW